MDNKNENTQSSIDNLSAENKKWLEDLLNGDSPAPENKADEPVAEDKKLITPEDEELEKILAEDWSSVPDIDEAELEQELKAIPAEAEISAVKEEAKAAPAAKQQSAPTPKAPAKAPAESKPQKGRPKKPEGYGLWGIPHILSTVIWLFLILAIGVSLGRVLWVCCADVMAFGKESKKVTITITEDDNITTISQKLGDAGLVRYPNLFKFFAEITGKDEDISVGTFTLNAHLDYNAMINAMVYYGSAREVVKIMFPEGANCAQIFKLLADKKVCSLEELEDYAANGELSEYWFLEGVPRGDKYCLEGYLAPDTYEFYTGDAPRRVLEKFLNEFDDRFTDKMKDNFAQMQSTYAAMLKARGYGSSYIKENTLTLHQVVTLASIVQKETASASECYDIASVFYNRLTNPNYLRLDSDATVYYAIGDYFGEVKELSDEHLNSDSPYNTRKNKGLPPGPICNMGVQALYAALEPNDTTYYYFVYDRSAYVHRFATTYAQHMQNVAELGD